VAPYPQLLDQGWVPGSGGWVLGELLSWPV